MIFKLDLCNEASKRVQTCCQLYAWLRCLHKAVTGNPCSAVVPSCSSGCCFEAFDIKELSINRWSNYTASDV